MSVKKLFLQDDDMVIIMFTDPNAHDGVHQTGIPRQDFENFYVEDFKASELSDFKNLKTLSYEPDVPLYHIQWQDNTVEAYSDYMDHPLFQVLHDLFSTVQVDELIIRTRRYTRELLENRLWLQGLKVLSAHLEISPRLKRIKDIPVVAFIEQSQAKLILDGYGVDEQLCIDDATTPLVIPQLAISKTT